MFSGLIPDRPHPLTSVFTHSDHVFRDLPFFFVPRIGKFVINLIQGVARCSWQYHLSRRQSVQECKHIHYRTSRHFVEKSKWYCLYEDRCNDIYPPPPLSGAYMRQKTGSSLVQVMAGILFGAKQLPEAMLAYCQLGSWEQISMKLESEFYHFHSGKCIWNCLLNCWRVFPGVGVGVGVGMS